MEMATEEKPKKHNFDLEKRTFIFAKQVILYVNQLTKSISNIEIGRQLIRSSGSVGANYIEANESLGKKDFLMRVKISKREAKESQYWLKLSEPKSDFLEEQTRLIEEAQQLMKIFGAIIENFKKRL